MEPVIINNKEQTKNNAVAEAAVMAEEVISTSTTEPFIEANTIESTLGEISDKHIIPVFVKDNEPVISHSEFISSTMAVTRHLFNREKILNPSIRLSHPIKGRIPEARNKPAKALLEHEKTLYYERMAFIIEIPTIYEDIDGQRLTLTVGGIKAFNLDRLQNKKGSGEHFKVFIGFQNKVCTNLCVWTDGYASDIVVSSLEQLQKAIFRLISSYNAVRHIKSMSRFPNYSLTEQQFAQVIGRCRMYHYLPKVEKREIPPLLFGDSQINAVCRDYYQDERFCRRRTDGEINLWRIYGLFTSANKSSYIDKFLPRSVNAFQFCEELRLALDNPRSNWYLN